MKKLFLFYVCLLVTEFTYANTPHLYALHINGVNTTRDEARKNIDALKVTAHVDSNMVTFNYIWNPTGPDAGQNIVNNISDLISQKAQEQQSIMTIDDFTDYYISQNSAKYPPATYHRGTLEYKQLQKQLYDEYYEKLNLLAGKNFDTIINEFHDEVPSQFTDVVNLLAANPNTHNNKSDYPKNFDLKNLDIFKNAKQLTNQNVTLDYSKSLDYILLIPHSQGNLYANSLYEYLTKNEKLSRNHIEIYGIATPATSNKGSRLANLLNISKVFGNTDSYITSVNDFVINTARLAFAPPLFDPILPANTDIPFIHSSDWGSGHSLINVYLKDPAAKAQIQKMIHLELFYFQGFISEELDENNFILSIHDQEFGGGLVSETAGLVCLDGACDPKVQYFKASEYEVQTFWLDAPMMSYVPREYFPAGTYFALATTYRTLGLHAQKNYPIEITYPVVTSDSNSHPPKYYASWNSGYFGFTCSGIDPAYYYLFPNNFWNGRFIAQYGYVK